VGTAKTVGTTTTVTYAAVKGTVSHVSGCNLVFLLDTSATKVVENGLYRLVVSSVPTAQSAVWGPMMNMGSLSVGLGKVATGGTAWSSAQFFKPLAAMSAKKGLTLLEFETASVTVSRGTYTKNAVCVVPGGGAAAFAAAISAKPNGANFKLNPASVTAAMGDAKGCADMGTGSTTQLSMHNVYWTVENGTTLYTNLPVM
jgi:hypothetical protein